MIIIIGLGNPGKKYIKARHNLGFRVIDRFAKTTTHPPPSQPSAGPLKNFPQFKVSKKFTSLISEGRLNKKKIILAKPQTFMNQSGKAVRSLVNFYKITRSGLVVVHDDVDLPLGKIKISKGRGAAGHRGIQSIIDELGTKNFVRFRIGIRPAISDKRQVTRVEDFVLEKFTKKEEEILKEVAKKAINALKITITEGVEKAMQDFNQ